MRGVTFTPHPPTSPARGEVKNEDADLSFAYFPAVAVTSLVTTSTSQLR